MGKRRLFHEDWYFLELGVDSKIEDLWEKENAFKQVNLPHDWQIYHADELYRDGIGWYRKRFFCEKKPGKQYEIYFDGVYMDCTVYLNRQVLGEWKYGYSSFYFDMTDFLCEGENEIVVQVRFLGPNSRWYSGAGIYQNVYLTEYGENHFVTDGVYLTTDEKKDGWQLTVEAELAWNRQPEGGTDTYCVEISVTDLSGTPVAEECCPLYGKETMFDYILKLPQVVPWSLQKPALYLCSLKLMGDDGKKLEDEVCQRIGFRRFSFDTEKGFFLNGVHTKLNGVCEHHDLGALGAAFHRMAMRRKMLILKEMGVNSIRCAHNMPAPELLDLADEMGILIVDEAFDMWERAKTPYDYARFFPEWYQRDVKSWICRDRNHPCILFWSIGNEIYDTHVSERGQEVTRLLYDEVRRYDPRGHAMVTIGSNFMPWENARKCADILKFAGYNYGEKYYEEHHKKHPDWYVYGSETSSTVQSRGIYHFPYRQSVLADEDEQCSSLGNSSTSWGAKNSETCIITERDCEFSLGQYLWSGFDYIGEPTPYHTRNSYFGQIDTAGFPKDSYYLYQAAWIDRREKPVVHVFPYWDFNPGQLIDVRIASNADVVELLVNGVSKGRQRINHTGESKLTGDYRIAYEKGEITAVAYDENLKEIARETRSSFGEPVRLILTQYEPERTLFAGTGDMAFFTVVAVDEADHPVENANNRIEVSVEGAGWLTGLDNGDSTDMDEYKGSSRRLFSGKLLILAAIGENAGNLRVSVSSQGLTGAWMQIPVAEGKKIRGISLLPEQWNEKVRDLECWVRKIELTCEGGMLLSEEKQTVFVEASILPEEAAANVQEDEIIWRVVNDAGIESPIAKVRAVSGRTGQKMGKFYAEVMAYSDGEFHLKCMTKNHTDKVKVISQLDFRAEGLGESRLDPYGFISGGLYTYVEGDVGNGNEHGVSTAREGRTVIGYERVDFGNFGSDCITLSVFELGGAECPIEIWEGIPGAAGSGLLATVCYHKPSIWNVYQEETYALCRRVTGVTQISFVLHQKIHLKGFSFARKQKAYEKLNAAENDGIYGDNYEICKKAVHGIGNNVTLEYREMDFGDKGCDTIVICGKSEHDCNTIHLIFDDGKEEKRFVLEFAGTAELSTQRFSFEIRKGMYTVRFVFLPGSRFDFEWFQFQI